MFAFGRTPDARRNPDDVAFFLHNVAARAIPVLRRVAAEQLPRVVVPELP